MMVFVNMTMCIFNQVLGPYVYGPIIHTLQPISSMSGMFTPTTL